MSSSHLSVQDLMLASECLMISRTVNPEGPACMAIAFLQLRPNDIDANVGSIQTCRMGSPMRKPEASRVTRSSTPLKTRHQLRCGLLHYISPKMQAKDRRMLNISLPRVPSAKVIV